MVKKIVHHVFAGHYEEDASIYVHAEFGNEKNFLISLRIRTIVIIAIEFIASLRKKRVFIFPLENLIANLLDTVNMYYMYLIEVCEKTRKYREPDGRDEVESSRVGFPKISRNSATVSLRTTLQCSIAAFKIRRYTVQFLLSVKLSWKHGFVRPDVNERVTACLVLGHYVRC